MENAKISTCLARDTVGLLAFGGRGTCHVWLVSPREHHEGRRTRLKNARLSGELAAHQIETTIDRTIRTAACRGWEAGKHRRRAGREA